MGHKENDCRKKKRDEENGTTTGTRDAENITSDIAETQDAVLIGHNKTNNKVDSDTWLGDSGATLHMMFR